MYNRNKKPKKTLISVNKSTIGEMIEKKVDRMVNNGEPLKENVKLIYQERKDGVQPDYDIRTDKMEHALNAMDIASKTHRGQRNKRIEDAKKNMETEKKSETTKDITDKGAGPSATNDTPKAG